MSDVAKPVAEEKIIQKTRELFAPKVRRFDTKPPEPLFSVIKFDRKYYFLERFHNLTLKQALDYLKTNEFASLEWYKNYSIFCENGTFFYYDSSERPLGEVKWVRKHNVKQENNNDIPNQSRRTHQPPFAEGI